MDAWAPNIYEYIDYRAFLGDYYVAAKSNNSAFSYRYFARKAGYSSPNFLKLVIDGKRNLSPDSIDRFSIALRLNRSEKRFFADLVAFDQAETPRDRNRAFERVAASRRFRSARRLDNGFFEYLSNWYYPVIREMTARADFEEDPAWIAAELYPPIKPAEAARALELLLELGLVVRDEDGVLTRGEPSLTTGHEVRSLAIGNYHRQMLERAADSIEIVKRERRDISATTVCISMELVPELKQRIHGFREVINDLCDRDPSPDTVYQLNIQLFPLTDPDGPEP